MQAVGATDGPAVPVSIHWLVDHPVAVVVDSVADLGLTRTSQRVAVIAVEVLTHIEAVAVDVVLVRQSKAIAVVVEAVAHLGSPGVAAWIGVGAVASAENSGGGA